MIVDKVWGKKLALVVVDPQRKFTIPSPDWDSKRDAAVKGINRYARLFREYGMPVIFIRYIGKSHTGYDGEDSEEWLQGLEVEPSDIIVPKENMSCFKQTELADKLHGLGVETIILCGMLTEFCVASTYFTSGDHNIVSYLAHDALLAYQPNGNDAAYVLCNTVKEDVLRYYFEGKQAPFEEEF